MLSVEKVSVTDTDVIIVSINPVRCYLPDCETLIVDFDEVEYLNGDGTARYYCSAGCMYYDSISDEEQL